MILRSEMIERIKQCDFQFIHERDSFTWWTLASPKLKKHLAFLNSMVVCFRGLILASKAEANMTRGWFWKVKLDLKKHRRLSIHQPGLIRYWSNLNRLGYLHQIYCPIVSKVRTVVPTLRYVFWLWQKGRSKASSEGLVDSECVSWSSRLSWILDGVP